MSDLTKDIDIATDGEHAEHGEAKLVMTVEQLDKLAEVLDTCVNLEMLHLDWHEPKTAIFVHDLIAAIRAARPASLIVE